MIQKSPPEIVGMIAALTDHRDVALLEASLLKTVADLFAPEWATIFHLDAREKPEFALALRNGEISNRDFAVSYSLLVSSAGVTAFPIMSHSRHVLGYLLVQRNPGLTSTEQKLMTDLFRIYDNYITVLKDSQVDRLTGLLNRHTFDDQLERALTMIRESYQEHRQAHSARRANDRNGCFFLGEIDIDHFKRINDQFGHLYGDEVLIIVARILQSTFRRTDLIYRFGGEEFVVIVYVENRDDAEFTFERLRRSIENHAFPQVGHVTVSIGVTEIRGASIHVELLGHADQALYFAKNHGRNQVRFYEALVEEHEIAVHRNSDDMVLFGSDEAPL